MIEIILVALTAIVSYSFGRYKRIINDPGKQYYNAIKALQGRELPLEENQKAMTN